MTTTRSTLAAIGATALIASGATFLVMTSTVTASGTTYQLQPGDYVAVSALNWTCGLTKKPSLSFSCSTNDKPVSDVNITPDKILVAARTSTLSANHSQDLGRSSRPTKEAHGAYSFTFTQR